jgi:hypothetical protein
VFDRGDTDIRKLVSDLGLAPGGRVSDSYERFLCKVNPHICTIRVGGKTEWRESAFIKNYEADLRECVDRTMHPSVLCLPNIRLESYRTVREERLDPGQATLERTVLAELDGCARWDDSCRTLVRRLNRGLPDSAFLPSGNLAPSFSGRVVLPTTGYRLSVNYEREENRPRLERAIAGVVSDRARALRIEEGDVGIRVAYPVGDPVSRAAAPMRTMGGEPEKGYADVLRIMNYPFLDQSPDELFKTWRQVTVGIWDKHVHETHCEFMQGKGSIVVSTLAEGRRDTNIPHAAKQCAEVRPKNYAFSDHWDHGTSVAGVIAAQVNGVGIAGAYPHAKIWAWELLSGDQINKADHPELLIVRERVDPMVVNISQSFPATARYSDMEQWMFGLGTQLGMHRIMLFVAAAGLHRRSVHDFGIKVDSASGTACIYFPACWGNVSGQKRNLISVVALDGSGTEVLTNENGVPLSNYGQAFDVSAVGVTQTTMYGDWLGTMVGSSFATPYVTSLAALLISKAKSLTPHPFPARIKERILATADRHPVSLRDTSRFGRINFGRALDFERDVVVVNEPALRPCAGCPLTGMIDRIGQSITFDQYTGSPPTEVNIPLMDIRRIIHDGKELYTVYSLGADGLLEKRERLKFRKPDEEFDIGTGKDARRFKLRHIEDMTACSIVYACGGGKNE